MSATSTSTCEPGRGCTAPGRRSVPRGVSALEGCSLGIMSWLPKDFVHPVFVAVPGTALHLRPIKEADTALDYPAVMGSRERLWEIFGPAWAWPKETMTYEEDRKDLLRHEKEIAAHESFNYALL